jgi:hypothetical protein
MVTMGILPYQGKNPHGRAGNKIRDLMISSQKRWPPDREAGCCLHYLWFGHPASCTIGTGAGRGDETDGEWSLPTPYSDDVRID